MLMSQHDLLAEMIRDMKDVLEPERQADPHVGAALEKLRDVEGELECSLYEEYPGWLGHVYFRER